MALTCVMVAVLGGCGTQATAPSGTASSGALPGTTQTSASATPTAAATIQPHPFAGASAWIAYQSIKGGQEGVWLIHPDGADDHEIGTEIPGEHLHPDWSPDGTRLVLTSRTERDVLYVVDVASETSEVLIECAGKCLGDDEAVWSPDGTQLALVRASEPFIDDVPSCALMVADVATGEVARLTKAASCLDRPTFPHWSRDGTRLAYYRGVYPTPDSAATSTAVYVLDVRSGDETKITDDALFGGDSDWAPGDKWLIVSTYPLNDFQCCAISNLYRVEADGSGLTQLTSEGTDRRLTQPRFTPDGSGLVVTIVGETRTLGILPADASGEAVAVPGSGIFTHGTWQPSS